MKKWIPIVAGVIGCVFVAFLVADLGLDKLLTELTRFGWGILAITIFEIVPLSCKARAWHCLLQGQSGVGYFTVLQARWIRQSVSQLLPVAQIGGDLIGARVLFLGKVPGSIAGAATLADMSFAAVAQLVGTIAGLTLLSDDASTFNMRMALLSGAGAFAFGLAFFFWLQHEGLFSRLGRTAAKASDEFKALSGGAAALDEALLRIYAHNGRWFKAFAWQLTAQLAAAGETFLICWFLGVDVSLIEVLILQFVSRGLRLAAFFVPGGIGVQEGAFVLLATNLGIGAEFGLVIALVKRAREIIVAMPALYFWYRSETRNLSD